MFDSISWKASPGEVSSTERGSKLDRRLTAANTAVDGCSAVRITVPQGPIDAARLLLTVDC